LGSLQDKNQPVLLAELDEIDELNKFDEKSGRRCRNPGVARLIHLETGNAIEGM
jgi:hypothetical protein